MVHVCVVPGRSNRSNRETDLSYHCLPLKNKTLLKVWIHKIGRKNLPLNEFRVYSSHFINSSKSLRPDEYPTVNLPSITTPVRKRKEPAQRSTLICVDVGGTERQEVTDSTGPSTGTVDSAVQTENIYTSIDELQQENIELKKKVEALKFRLSSIQDDDKQIQFYTGFPTYSNYLACFNFLGPAVNCLCYWGSQKLDVHEKRHAGGRSRSLAPLEEFFIVPVRLRLKRILLIVLVYQHLPYHVFLLPGLTSCT